MARPQKEGLDYFPLDVDMDQDDKLFFIEAKHGLIGFAIVVRLLMQIYKEGYYKHYDDNKDAFLFAKRLSVDVNVIKNVVNDCINEGFFNKYLYEKYGILTSRGIQKRYLEACTRRKKVSIIKEYCLIDTENYKNIVFEYINPINVDINPDKCNITSAETPQSKVKESKVKNIERDISAHARNNTSQEKSQEENFDDEIAKIYNKAFEFSMTGITPEFIEDAKMRLSGGTDVDLIIKALSIGATKAHGSAGAKCRYAISVLQSWAAEGIKTLTQWEAKNVPKSKARDKPDKPIKTQAQEREEAFERAREEARRMLREEGVIQDDV